MYDDLILGLFYHYRLLRRHTQWEPQFSELKKEDSNLRGRRESFVQSHLLLNVWHECQSNIYKRNALSLSALANFITMSIKHVDWLPENTYPLVYYNITQNLTVLGDNAFSQFMTNHISSQYLSACGHIYLAELSSIWKTGQVKLKICLLINIEYNWLWNDEAIWLEWIWRH